MCGAAVPASAYYSFALDPGLAILGDMDGDRIVNIIDVTYLQRHLVGIPLLFDVDELAADAD